MTDNEPTMPLPTANPSDPQPVTEPMAATASPAQQTAYTGYPYADPRPVATSVRVGTIVWGLVLALLGVCVIAASLGNRLDMQLVFIVLLCVAGVALVAGSIITTVRRRH